MTASQQTEAQRLADALIAQAAHHFRIASDCDMRPEDTANWQHGVDCTDAAAELRRLDVQEADGQLFVAQTGDALDAREEEIRTLHARIVALEADNERLYRLASLWGHVDTAARIAALEAGLEQARDALIVATTYLHDDADIEFEQSTAAIDALDEALAQTAPTPELPPPPCKHLKAKCVYDSDDGEYEKWECPECGERWGVEIPQ